MKALNIARELLDQDHLETITIINNRAIILLKINRLNEALKLGKIALANKNLTLSSGHSQTILAMNNLATVRYARNEITSARKLRFGAYTLALMNLGHENSITRMIVSALEQEFKEAEDFRALTELREYRMKWFMRLYGDSNDRTLRSMNSVLLAYMSASKWFKAQKVSDLLIKGLRPKKLEVDKAYFWRAASQKMSKVYDLMGNSKEAAPLREEALQMYLRDVDFYTDFGYAAARDLARVYHRLKDWANAIRCGLLTVDVSIRIHGLDSDKTIIHKRELATAYWAAKQPQKGFDLDLDTYRTSKQFYGAVHTTTVEILLALCEIMRSSEQKDAVLHFYDLLAFTKKLCVERLGNHHADEAKIEYGLDVLFRKAPGEWRPEMLAIR